MSNAIYISLNQSEFAALNTMKELSNVQDKLNKKQNNKLVHMSTNGQRKCGSCLVNLLKVKIWTQQNYIK